MHLWGRGRKGVGILTYLPIPGKGDWEMSEWWVGERKRSVVERVWCVCVGGGGGCLWACEKVMCAWRRKDGKKYLEIKIKYTFDGQLLL